MYSLKKFFLSFTAHQIIFGASLFFSNICLSQTAFFSSKIAFTETQLEKFNSAFTLSGNHVIFNANDYTTYNYNKQTGEQLWLFITNRKSNNPPYVYGENVITAIYEDEVFKSAILPLLPGKSSRTLPMGPLLSVPVFKGDIMYGTALHEGGKLLAYDLKQNKMIWEQFVAHGVETQPYFLKDKIVANAEGDNWFDMDYSGKFLQTGCYSKAQLFVENIKCVRNFKFLTHDDRDITESFLEKYFGADAEVKERHTDTKTFLTDGNLLVILGNDKKILKQIELSQIAPPEGDPTRYKIIKIENEKIWLLGNTFLNVYDHKADVLIKQYDLGKWNPHHVIIDDKKIWLVSKKDGQLYGLHAD